MATVRGTAMATVADLALVSASAGAWVAGASVGAAVGTIPIMGVTGAGVRLIMAAVSEVLMPTAVGAGVVTVATDTAIIPEPSLSTTGAWPSVPLRATG